MPGGLRRAPRRSKTALHSQAEPEAVFLRDIRHHDDHTPLYPGDADKDYLPLSVPDLRGDEYAPEPWTQPQARFARSRADGQDTQRSSGVGQDHGAACTRPTNRMPSAFCT